MITNVRIKNYRSLADVDLSLGELTVLVGRNAAGKSALLDALCLVAQAVETGLDAAITRRGGIGALRRWSPTGRPWDVEIGITFSREGARGEYSLTIGSRKDGDYRLKREMCRIHDYSSDATSSFERRFGKWVHRPVGPDFDAGGGADEGRLTQLDSNRLALPAIWFLGNGSFAPAYFVISEISLYTIFPNTLRGPQPPASDYPLEQTGVNMASVLREMQRKKGAEFEILRESLCATIDGITDLRVRQVGGFLVTELKHEGVGGRSPWFPLAQESDGTLRLLGLLTALFQYPQREFIAIEEPELAVHPGALFSVSETLREASNRSQILITTQSPDLISSFSAGDLRIVERADGITTVGEIDPVQRDVIDRQLFKGGDLLRIEGLYRARMADETPAHA